jgi:hypothetical protein
MVLVITPTVVRGHPTTTYTLLVTTTVVRTELFFILFFYFSPTAYQLIHPITHLPKPTTSTDPMPQSIPSLQHFTHIFNTTMDDVIIV